jgi:hypothetical protein
MKMREALFLSSKDATFYTRTNNGLDYRIRVEEDTEEYTPFFQYPLTEGPHFRIIYRTTVSLVKDDVILEPHQQYRCFDIDDAERFLKAWAIDTEAGWTPEEERSATIASLDTSVSL